MTYPAPLPTMAVPLHLIGTRAALFHLWRLQDRPGAPAAAAPPRPAPQAPAPALDRVRAALQADVFLFARSA